MSADNASNLALLIWEAVGDLDRIDETPHGKVPALLDALSEKLVRAAIDAEAIKAVLASMERP
ncbi:hypothetical protein [Blastomonas sp. CCH1-A6]|uniref:hypothetical protein n=1 Tax=Blastomonas sp. CCH1-A6 TaxID=1768762 RepID=UPI0008316BC4